MRSCVLAVIGLIAASLSAQSPSDKSVTIPRAVRVEIAANDLTANDLTNLIEKYLATKGVDLPAEVDGPRPHIDVDIDQKKPITPPTPPPPPPPNPPVPPGPLPFHPKPPMLEEYREALEVMRIEIEKERTSREITLEQYVNGIEDYRRRIELYRRTTKLVIGKDDTQ